MALPRLCPVRSLNQDKPFDLFLLEQIAGDELDHQNFELRVATGFLRVGPQHVVAGNQIEALNRQEWFDRGDARHRQWRVRLDGRLRALPRPQVRSDPQADYTACKPFSAQPTAMISKRLPKQRNKLTQEIAHSIRPN